VITYRVTLDAPVQLLLKVSDLLMKHRAELGTRDGTRALTCWQQAKFILAWFRDKPGLRRLGEGFGIAQSTAYRYKDEGVEVLAREAPSLEKALERAAEQGIPYVILDGALIPADRCSDKKTSRKGTGSTNGTPGRRTSTPASSRASSPRTARPCGHRRSVPAAPTTSPQPASWSCPACGPGWRYFPASPIPGTRERAAECSSR
jgi:hypothetical protein